MWMFSACVYFELAIHLTAKSVVWKHALNSTFHNEFRLGLHHITVRLFSEATWITAVVIVFLLEFFLTGQDCILSVNNDNEIPTINVRGISGFVFTSQNCCCLGCNAAKRLASCIDDIPFSVNFASFCHKSCATHVTSSFKLGIYIMNNLSNNKIIDGCIHNGDPGLWISYCVNHT